MHFRYTDAIKRKSRFFMKKDTHPPYQEVLFVDSSTGHKFVCGSTLQPKQQEEFEGKKYPVHHVPISSFSHPFFTKAHQFIDTEGRVDKFTKRYAKKQQEQKEELEDKQKKKAPVKKTAKKK
jgi:large subunit ribosomal protein L31